MLTMLRTMLIVHAVIAGLAASSVPAAAQSPLGKAMGEKWAKNCLTDSAKSTIRKNVTGGTSIGQAAQDCCHSERRADTVCKTEDIDRQSKVNCTDAEALCQSIAKDDPGLKADIQKAEKEKAEKEAEKEKAAAALICKGVTVDDFPARICCTSSKGSGCVKSADDCTRLGGAVKTSAEGACTKLFPGYTGHVAAVPELDCSSVKVDAVWIPDKGFKKLDEKGKCSKIYSCEVKPSTALPSPITTLCKPVPKPVSSLIVGTCTDATCSDCKVALPPDQCTVTFVKK